MFWIDKTKLGFLVQIFFIFQLKLRNKIHINTIFKHFIYNFTSIPFTTRKTQVSWAYIKILSLKIKNFEAFFNQNSLVKFQFFSDKAHAADQNLTVLIAAIMFTQIHVLLEDC